MNTCDTCKHWNYSEDDDEAMGIGRCKNIPQFWTTTEWNDEGDGLKPIKGHENAKAFVKDGSDYRAELLTLGSFGCVMHEDKK